MQVIVGSGPTGVSCARALLARGLPVTMIDAGLSLEPERQRTLATIRSRPPIEWKGELIAPLLDGTDPGVRGLPGKRTYGSDFAFRSVDPGNVIVMEAVDTLTSHAIGGLSNLWGANAFPFLDADIADWPLNTGDLAPYYRAVLSFMPLAATHDELESLFPMYTDTPEPLRPSLQASALLERLRRHEHVLRKGGFHFGQSRLAVRTLERAGAPGCVYCGLCLYGCPHELIYTSASTVETLKSHPRFRYLTGVLVDRFEERSGVVTVTGRRLANEERLSLEADRLFVACGVVQTARLVLESLAEYDREIDVLDSQYFMVPTFSTVSSPQASAQPFHTLSQVAMVLRDTAVSEHAVHLLVYTYNDMFRRALMRLPGLGARAAAPLRSGLLDRLAVIQGYLHSNDSSSIALRLENGEKGKRLVLRGRFNSVTRPAIRRLMRKLLAVARYSDLWPLTPMLQIGAPGKSYHIGGTFPMSPEPAELQTDLLGRLHGHQAVHLVDASIFPTIPATNSTLGAMANAYRIGTEAGT